MLDSKAQMLVLLNLYLRDQTTKSFILSGEKSDLFVKMPVNGLLNCLGAGHDGVATHKRGQKPKGHAADSPEAHRMTRPRLSRRHGVEKVLAMRYFVRERLGQKIAQFRVKAFGDPELGAIDTDGAEFASVIDLEDTRDGAFVFGHSLVEIEDIVVLVGTGIDAGGLEPGVVDRLRHLGRPWRARRQDLDEVELEAQAVWH